MSLSSSMENEYFSEEEYREFFHKKGLCGLANLGNSCFMNSIVQCLNNNRDFALHFISQEYLKDLNKDKIDYNLAEQWNLLTNGLYHRNCVVTPTSFHKCVQVLALNKGLGHFSGFGQNDSQEFLQFFLETLHNVHLLFFEYILAYSQLQFDVILHLL